MISHSLHLVWRSIFASLIMINVCFALPLNITPKAGTTLPTTYNGVIPVTAYYTVQNNTSRARAGVYVKTLPTTLVQVQTNGTYSDTCGASFTLAAKGQPGDSCTLQLSVLGHVNGKDTNQSNLIFACLAGGGSCAGANPQLNITMVTPWSPISVAYEIIYIANALSNPKAFVQTYKDAGSNPVSNDTAWDAYTTPPDYTKNTTRYLQFNEQVFLASPGQPLGSTTYIVTAGNPPGYTWGAMSNAINAMWPYDSSQYPTSPSNLGPFYAGNFTTTPPPGVLKVTSNYKAQYMKFYANENGDPPGTPGAVPILRFFIVDPWGNEYIMHASAYDTPTQVQSAFEAATLPAGFTKIERYLVADFILQPATGPDNAYEYNLLRDDQNSTYHQYKWGAQGISIASQIQEAGMPIWGGLTNDLIVVSQSFDYVIYGGGGKNVFKFLSTLTSGTNTIQDFNPNSDLLHFDGQTYSTVVTTTGIKILLQNGATVILSDIYYFQRAWVIG